MISTTKPPVKTRTPSRPTRNQSEKKDTKRSFIVTVLGALEVINQRFEVKKRPHKLTLGTV